MARDGKAGEAQAQADARAAAEDLVSEAMNYSLGDDAIRELLEEGRLDCEITPSGRIVARRKARTRRNWPE